MSDPIAPAADLVHANLGTDFFDAFAGSSFSWLHEAPKLHRAARAVLRESDDEWKWIRYATMGPAERRPAALPFRATISMQACMLAACAVECSLKGAILAKNPITSASSNPARLPKELEVKPSHDLQKLAAKAGVVPRDDDEEAVLRHGRSFIAWLGRYHLPLNATETWGKRRVSPMRTCLAFERLTFQCSDLIYSRHHARREMDGELDALLAQTRQRLNDSIHVGGGSFRPRRSRLRAWSVTNACAGQCREPRCVNTEPDAVPPERTTPTFDGPCERIPQRQCDSF